MVAEPQRRATRALEVVVPTIVDPLWCRPLPASVLRQMLAGWQIQTMEGWLDLTPGDWIIRSVASL
jgi:hypothetical protein